MGKIKLKETMYPVYQNFICNTSGTGGYGDYGERAKSFGVFEGRGRGTSHFY